MTEQPQPLSLPSLVANELQLAAEFSEADSKAIEAIAQALEFAESGGTLPYETTQQGTPPA